MEITTIGINLAKNVFHVHGVDRRAPQAAGHPRETAQGGRHAGAPGVAANGRAVKTEAEIHGRTPDERRRIRRQRTAPLLKDLRQWMDATLAQVSAKSPMALAIGCSLSNWTALTRFVEDGRIEAHNNAAERALRGVALGRKNYLQLGRRAGEFVFGHGHYGATEPGREFPDDLMPEEDVTLSQALGAHKAFKCLYDFGDCWWHKVKVEQIVNLDAPHRIRLVHRPRKRLPA